MTAADQSALLELQGFDSELDRLRHRRDTLPERTAVAEAERAAVAAKRAADALAARAGELGSRLAGLEADLAAAESRAAEIERRLRSGESTAARDVVRWSEEAGHQRERAAAIEDEAIEVLAEKEAVDAEVEQAQHALTAAVDEVRAARGRLAGAEDALDREVADLEPRRAALAGTVPAGLLGRYEALRARLGGVGAAQVDNGRCTGCHLDLSPRDLDDLRRLPEDEVATCESCGRILVR